MGGTTKAAIATCALAAVAMVFVNLGSAMIIVVDIGDLGGDKTELESALVVKLAGPYPTVINDLSQVTGVSWDELNQPHVFVWDEHSGMQSIGDGWFMEINNAGQVYYLDMTGDVNKGAVWKDGVTTYILAPNSDHTEISDLSEVGTAVGLYYEIVGSNYPQPFRKTLEGDYETLNPVSGDIGGWANSVNANGDAVGASMTSATNNRPCIWPASGGVYELEWAEGSESPGSTEALMINGNGQVMGWWRSNTMSPLMYGAFFGTLETGIESIGTLDGFGIKRIDAMDMNENGVLVGGGYDGSGGNWAFVWDKAMGMKKLPSFSTNPDGYSLATSINDVNQIAGWCVASDGYRHACLWESSSLSGPWTVRDLGAGPTEGSIYSEAYGINNKGEVVCKYVDSEYPKRVFVWKSLTAQEASGELAQDIEELVGDENLATSMTVKVGAAQNQMDRHNDHAAISILGALIKQTEALMKAGKISEVDGNYLIGQTQAIIDELMNPTP